MEKDWLYSPDRMQLREQCLSILLNKFGTDINDDGSLKVSTEAIYACAHDWVSQGHPSPMGIVAYFEAYHKDGQE